MSGNILSLEDLRSKRNTITCALLLIACWGTSKPALASGQDSPARYLQERYPLESYQQAEHRADRGAIYGWVVNGSRNQLAVGGTEVALRARLHGELSVAQVTTTDARGRFQFENLPLDAGIQYVPGANHGEVHYPGTRLSLTAENPSAQVKIVIYETSKEPNPLVMEQHDIVVRPRPGVLEVTESMVIINPSKMSFVGQPTQGSDWKETLQLAIPANFEQVTFEKEFYGRRFSLVDGNLSTDIPWPPGKRRLKFTYKLPHGNKGSVAWQRPVDLPCSLLRLTVVTDKPNEVGCNLKAKRSITDGRVTFTSSGTTLPAGLEIHLNMGPLTVPMMVYGRWSALAILVALVCGAGVLGRTRKVKKSPE